MGRARCRTRAPSLLAQAVLLMASSASALTLSDFQSIAASTVSLGCILVYNTSPLLGCSQSDFTAGRGCSASCVRSIRRVQSTLGIVCNDASVPAGSVLRAAMQGTLVDTLCGRGLEPPQTTTATRTTSTLPLPPPVSTTLRQPPPPSSTRPPPPTSTPQPLSPVTSTLPPISTLPAPPPPPPPPPSGTSSNLGSAERPPPTEAPRPSPTRGPQETTPASPQPPGQGGQRGGGSPFDPAFANAASPGLSANLIAVLAGASTLGLLIIEGMIL